MTEPSSEEPLRASMPPPRPGLRPRHLVAFATVLTFVVGAGLVVDRCAGRFFRPPPDDTSVVEVHPTAAVVVAIRDLARLETVSFHMERVIDLADRQERLFGLIKTQDAILLVAAADVTAGVDLTEMRDGDVIIDPDRKRARITLPRPRVFATRIDSARTYVHTRQTDALARRREDLETRARQEAERTLTQAALQAGILDRAKANAARTIETLVRALGYDQVEITWAAD